MASNVIEIVFSLDSTYSMEPCIEQVKKNLRDMVTRLQRDIPGIRIALVAHGDYPRKDVLTTLFWLLYFPYKFLIRTEDFTTDVTKLCAFVSALEKTDGGDPPEAYELALQEINGLSWTPGSRRVAVVIGDEVPHEPGSERNEQNINWRAEVDKLVAKGVKIYGVQCLNNSYAKPFYRHLADRSGGKYLRLGEFSNIRDLVMATCYRERGVRYLEDYEQEMIRREGPINRDMAEVFDTLRQ